ncbi:hypothetical protein, partial [Gluconobacter thailandicus]|uniref:hypothetical protein n=1 Tax=Gluconobacter thailandicus TaxID=257438 RepID=UPI001A7E27A4
QQRREGKISILFLRRETLKKRRFFSVLIQTRGTGHKVQKSETRGTFSYRPGPENIGLADTTGFEAAGVG